MPRLTIWVLLCVFAVSISGCSRPSSAIVGKWQSVELNGRFAYEFLSDGSVLFYVRSEPHKGTWRFLDEGRLEIELPDMATATRVFAVIFDGDRVVFKPSDGSAEAFKRVKDFASLDRAKDLTIEALGLWTGNKEKDYAKAVRLFREAAELGYAPAQTALGAAYSDGMGVAQDTKAAIGWWEKAAAQGDAAAFASLGNAYSSGNGVSRDYAKAVQLLTAAANQGNASAQNSLAWLYAACTDPNYQDGNRAVEYATKAVSQQPNTWYFVGTLSGAYARNDQFGQAIVQAKRAIELLQNFDGPVPESKQKWLARLTDMSESFKRHQPYTDK